VVKVELDLVGRGRDRLRTRVLDLLDEVLVRVLGEAAALLRVEVDVVNVDRRSGERLSRGAVRGTPRLTVRAVLPRLEVDVDADLVVLERNERDGNTRVAAEPELEGDVERLRRRARTRQAGLRRLRRRARRIERKTRLALEEDKVVRVTDDRVEGRNRASLRRELRPDLHPVTVLAVNALATNLNLNLLDEAVTDVVHPAESLHVDVRAAERNLGENNLNVRLVHQVRVTVDDRRDALVEVRLTVERHLNRLHRKVRVALLEDLPERDLGVARDVDILRAVAHKLHKTTTHLCL